MSLATVQLMSIMNEKVVHGRAMMPYIPPALEKQIAEAMVKSKTVGSEEEALAMLRNSDELLSILQNDAYTSVIHKQLERYDQALDELVLKSDNIVKSYNLLLEAEFEEALKNYKGTSVNSADSEYMPCFDSLDLVAKTFFTYKNLPGVDEAELKKAIINGTFFTSDNPEKIKAQLQIRINYNKAMISMFQEMLKTNYELLGFSKDEALILSQKLVSEDKEERKSSIKDLKAAVLANKRKFEMGKGRLDFRSIGGGVYFGTPEETGLDKFMSVDRMLQYTLEYDCIVFGHGDNLSKGHAEARADLAKIRDEIKDLGTQYRDEIYDYNTQLSDLYSKIANYMTHPAMNSLKNSFKDSLEAKIDALGDLRHKMKKRTRDLKELTQILNNPDEYDLSDEDINKFTKIKDSLEQNYEKTKNIMKECIKRENALYDELRKKYGDGDDIDEKMEKVQIEKYGKKWIDEFKDKNKYIIKVKETISELDKKENDAIKYLEARKMHDYTEGGKVKPGLKSTWFIQPVWTENAGPFTEMNELVRQCIKEGHKRILVVSCNPGHHVLDKDLRDRKDVLIRHAENTLLAESVVAPMDDPDWDAFDPLDEASQILFETEQHLIQACNESGFDYYDDEYLNECALFVEQNVETLNEEGIGRKIWTKIKELAKKVFGLFVKLIKGVINFFRNLIDKIKNFFKKLFGSGKVEKPLRKSFKTSFIMVESASVRNLTVNNWDVLQKGCLDSCEKIANKIKKVEREQTALFKQAEQFAEQQERKAPQNENAYTSYTIEMLKRLAGI